MTLALGVVVAFSTLAIQSNYLASEAHAEVQLARAARIYDAYRAEPVSLDRSVAGGGVYTQQYMLSRHLPMIDVLASAPPAGSLVILGPRVLEEVAGECLGRMDHDNRLVRIGQGDPANCPD